jgi:hypothetical protein
VSRNGAVREDPHFFRIASVNEGGATRKAFGKLKTSDEETGQHRKLFAGQHFDREEIIVCVR